MVEHDELIHEGRFLNFGKAAGWEFVRRNNAKGVVGVLAVTADREVLLVEQHRPPLKTRVIELPAGLAGDEPYKEDEPLLAAAKRELYEETGYEARNWWSLMDGPTSSGLTDEVVTIFMATGLTQVSERTGRGSEDIRLHRVRIAGLVDWLKEQREDGRLIDFKIHAALYVARNHPMFPA